MAKDTSFKKELNCPEATKTQQQVAMEIIRSEIFRGLEDNKIGSEFKELVQSVGEKYNIEDTSEILEMMIGLLNSGEYLYKVDENGYLVSNYSKHDILQKQFQDGKNKEADEKLQSYVERAKDIFNNLSEKERYNEKAIEKGFGQYDWEKEHLWIELAVEKVWGRRLEICTKPKEVEEIDLG